jgi:hypothetical protein
MTAKLTESPHSRCSSFSTKPWQAPLCPMATSVAPPIPAISPFQTLLPEKALRQIRDARESGRVPKITPARLHIAEYPKSSAWNVTPQCDRHFKSLTNLYVPGGCNPDLPSHREERAGVFAGAPHMRALFRSVFSSFFFSTVIFCHGKM